MIDLAIRNAGQVVTCTGDPGLADGTAVAIDDGKIVAVGKKAETMEAREVIDAGGGVVMPGLIDCHTHAVFAGHRAQEFEERARGVPYEEIAQRGGGIRASMRMLREASDDELARAVKANLDRFLALGTTTIEAKSGYGLSLHDELRSLRALGIEHDVEVVRTCLAAHSVPPEYEHDREAYLKLVTEEIYPAVASEGVAVYCDIFCEQGVFTVEESRRILEAGKRHGLRPRVHADQLRRTGGAKLAAEVGAITADHIEYATKEDAEAMASAGTIAVLLPAANYVLDQHDRPDTQAFRDAGCEIAIATDYNPGSAPTQSMWLTMNMACVRFGMTAAEAIVGATRIAAKAIERDDLGTLEEGQQADVLVCDAKDYRELPYWLGRTPTTTVVKKGFDLTVR